MRATLLAAALFVLHSAPAAAQGQWMDVGSGAAYTIAVENHPESFQRFPPFAFGRYAPGNLVWSELLGWPCSGLPSTAICASGRFVAAFNATLDTGSCPCSGTLLAPVYLELAYDPSVVQALGAREQDLVLSLYDNEFGEWVELPEDRVVPERYVVTGSQESHARQYYAILVRELGPQSSWGRIKDQFLR